MFATSGTPYRALIVEDDPAISKLVQKLLMRRSIATDVASDGRVAKEKLTTTVYSVVILDLMIPEVDGFAVIEFLKTRDLRIPVVVVSAVSQQALTKLDRDIVKLVIAKPFDVNELTKGVVKLCEESH